MKKALLLAALLALSPSWAGEKYLGAIVSGAGADTTNDSTATPFKIPLGSKLTVNCTAAANVCVDTGSACTALGGANPGVPVAASTNFPTSVASYGPNTYTVSSGTAANGGSVVRIVGTGAVTCYVWLRMGDE